MSKSSNTQNQLGTSRTAAPTDEAEQPMKRQRTAAPKASFTPPLALFPTPSAMPPPVRATQFENRQSTAYPFAFGRTRRPPPRLSTASPEPAFVAPSVSVKPSRVAPTASMLTHRTALSPRPLVVAACAPRMTVTSRVARPPTDLSVMAFVMRQRVCTPEASSTDSSP